MANIPPHYSDRFIAQRYNKALNIVQNLPATSNFQPTKNQKLELYALYKQVSVGDVDTQRPGLFDVVGRAKWDAWKKLQGLSVLEARHMYVEALLRIATESFKKNIGREEAQRIIHAFAIMKPSGEDTSDDLLDTDYTSNQEDDTSAASEDEEEQAYLRNIEESKVTSFIVPENNNSISNQQTKKVQILSTNRPASAASVQSMVTAPMTPRQMPIKRPPSASSSIRARSKLSYITNEKQNSIHMIKDDVLPNQDEYIDPNINPWEQLQTTRNNEEVDSIDNNSTGSRARTPLSVRSTLSNSQLRLPSPIRQYQQRLSHLSSPSLPPQYVPTMTPINQPQLIQSPLFGSSTSSSVTATPHNRIPNNSDQSYIATVALGPATKKALESLQNEVISLNNRIDDLRKELVERDKQRSIQIKKSNSSGQNSSDSTDDIGENWRWVIKAALRYAGINLMTAFVIFFILYKNGNPIAYAILKQFGKFWQSTKLRVSISNVVV